MSKPLAPDRLLFLAGPTAVGKSNVALLLAEQLDGEIVSVDSMQVYRGLDIGTAKPSLEQRARVRHHLVDVADLNEQFDAAKFVQLAQAAVAEIQQRGRWAIFCGGTGLYFKAFLDGLGDAPPGNAGVRAELEQLPLPELLRELAQRDPVTYDKIDRQNPRRVVRALEVIRLTNKPFSAQRAQWQNPSPYSHGARFFCLRRSVEDLRSRIDARVDEMFSAGLVAETESLLKQGLAQNQTASQALGYKQVIEHVNGERNLLETIHLVKIRTRQFAKRQMTWFRRQLPVEWLDITPQQDAEKLAVQLGKAAQSFVGDDVRSL
jgi:tRNA dimethylallyltransferase